MPNGKNTKDTIKASLIWSSIAVLGLNFYPSNQTNDKLLKHLQHNLDKEKDMCNYEHKYYDFSPTSLLFKCEEKDVEDGFCIFHHPRYWRDFPEKVRDGFYQKINFSTKNNEKLQCVGFNFPKISLMNLELPMPVDFSNSIFHDLADFSGTVFNGTANFWMATFNGQARFSKAIFNKKVCLVRTTFNEKAYFRATFNSANFSMARFNGDTYFSNAVFSESVKFHEAKFNKKVDFAATKICRGAYFSKATFNEVEFVGLVRQKDGVLSANDPVLIFRQTTFNEPKKARFDQLDLSNVSFLLTDISQIDIGEDVRWDTNKKLLDERLAEKGEFSYEKVATVYRRLRQNLESKLRYVEAGRFFIAEMEAKRKNVKTKNRSLKWLYTNILSPLAWYKYFSNYGESYPRVMLWIVLTPFVAALLTALFIAPPFMKPPLHLSLFHVSFLDRINSLNQFLINLLNHYKDYLFAFFQLKSDNFGELALRLFSLLLMGQLYIALRRQFERRGKENPAT